MAMSERLKTRFRDLVKEQYGRYPNGSDEHIKLLIKRLDRFGKIVERALVEHIEDATPVGDKGYTVGENPPSVAEMVQRCKRIEAEQGKAESEAQQQLDRANFLDARKRWVDIPADVQGYFPLRDSEGRPTGRLRTQVQAYRSECKHCGDTGNARFFSKGADPALVYLAPEVIAMPLDIAGTLRPHTAICDCTRGQTHSRRGKTVTRPVNGMMTVLKVVPHLEKIRELVAKRQRAEQSELGVMAA